MLGLTQSLLALAFGNAFFQVDEKHQRTPVLLEILRDSILLWRGGHIKAFGKQVRAYQTGHSPLGGWPAPHPHNCPNKGTFLVRHRLWFITAQARAHVPSSPGTSSGVTQIRRGLLLSHCPRSRDTALPCAAFGSVYKLFLGVLPEAH